MTKTHDFLLFQLLGIDETKKLLKLSKGQVLEKLRDSLINSKKKEIETKGFEQAIKNTSDPNKAIELVKKIERLIKCSKNNILTLAYQQGKVFQKLKKDNGFINTVAGFEKSKTTINFKIDIVNFIEKYPRMKKSCISLFYLKNNFRIIKNICQEHAIEFQ